MLSRAVELHGYITQLKFERNCVVKKYLLTYIYMRNKSKVRYSFTKFIFTCKNIS